MNGTHDTLLSYINEIIYAAVQHGGDLGGPYCSNLEGLYAAMAKLRHHIGAHSFVIVHAQHGALAYARPVEDTEGSDK